MPEPTPHIPIVCRRVTIPFEAARARRWYRTRSIEDVLNALSFVLPVGEKYFIQSVLHYQDRVTDPLLRDELRRFGFQEAMHSKEHARGNDALRQAYPQGAKIEKLTARLVALNRFVFPAAWQLASTCALEHFTTILAHELLKNPRTLMAKGDPAFVSLWLWHAAEETEHKAVCYDVYQSVFGKGVPSYLLRIAAMIVMTGGFFVLLASGMAWIKKTPQTVEADAPPDATPPTPPPGTLDTFKDIVPMKLYFDYFRPGFHPWDNDNRALVEDWKSLYGDFGAIPQSVTAS